MRKVNRLPKITDCYTEGCNGVARTKGLCVNCAHKKRKQEAASVETLELGVPLDDDTGER